MRKNLEELKKLIDCIQSLYTDVTNEWMSHINVKVNLKKLQVSDIDKNGIIYKNIIDYVDLLSEQGSEILLQFSGICSYEVTTRIKAQNSIESKIQRYKTRQHEYGRVPIVKCINDLFGIRIIMEEPLSFEEIYAFVKEKYEDNYKCIDSSKLNYKAVHIYFKQNNQSFPWELQIWNKCDAENNFASHKRYKQGYTIWEGKSKEGGTIND